MITQITDHQTQAIARLAEQYKDKPFIEALVGLPAASLQEVENTAWDVLTKRGIDSGEGTQLDNIGVVVGEERFGDSDADYRIRLKARTRANKSLGTLESVVEVLVLLTGLGIIIQDLGDASMIASFDGPLGINEDGNPSSRFLQDIVPISVDSHLVFKHNTGAPSFKVGLMATSKPATTLSGTTNVNTNQTLEAFPDSGTIQFATGLSTEETVDYGFKYEDGFGAMSPTTNFDHVAGTAITLVRDAHSSGNSFGFGTTVSGSTTSGTGASGGGELTTVVVSGTGDAYSSPLFGIFPQSLDEMSLIDFPNLGTPTAIFKFDVASGNVEDKLSGKVFVAQGSNEYRVASSGLPGHLAVKTTESATGGFKLDSTGLTDGSVSFAILLVCQTDAFVSSHNIVSRGDSSNPVFWEYGRLGVSSGDEDFFSLVTDSDGTQTMTTENHPQPELLTILLGVDLNASAFGTLKAYTQIGSHTFDLPSVPKVPVRFLSVAHTVGEDSGNIPGLLYLAVWEGAAAEGFTAADLNAWITVAGL